MLLTIITKLRRIYYLRNYRKQPGRTIKPCRKPPRLLRRIDRASQAD
jgi:hypothetical protein